MLSKAAQELGRKGGQAKSEKKTAAVRKNAKKPRKKWITSADYCVIGADGAKYHGHLIWYKLFDPVKEANQVALHQAITDDLVHRRKTSALPVKELVEFDSASYNPT